MNPKIGFLKQMESLKHPDPGRLFQYAWLEGFAESCLVYTEQAGDWDNLARWPAGRLFDEDGEYRWQRAPEKKSLHSVLILENGQLPVQYEGQLNLSTVQDEVLVLWGDWVSPQADPKGNPNGGPCFYAREIPHIQTYPFPPGPYSGKVPCLVVRRYRHKHEGAQDSCGEFIRCVSLTLQAVGEDHEVDQPV